MRRLILAALLAGCMPASWGADAIVHPYRRHLSATPPMAYQSVRYSVDGVTLDGWLFKTTAPRRGLLVYLHGVADNRASVIGFAQRYLPRGWDVLAYDSRAHGESGGTECTYGYYERRDLHAVLDQLGADRVVLFGHSMGAAIALEEAPDDPRVKGVVAISSFAELRTVVEERAPFFASQGNVRDAIALAEQRAHFVIDEVAPAKLAPRIYVPVLVIHGDSDSDTVPKHSERIYANLPGPKRLLLVPAAHHNDVLSHREVWDAIDSWLAQL